MGIESSEDDVRMTNPRITDGGDSYFQLDPTVAWRVFVFHLIRIGVPIIIFGGIFTNVLAFFAIVGGRLWLKHEGYVYLAANLCVNIAALLFRTGSYWYLVVYGGTYHLANTSNFMCKLWSFLTDIYFVSGWLSVAFFFSVLLREHLTYKTSCATCPVFAAKYCTLFASKIIVGVIFGLFLLCGVPHLAIYEVHSHSHSVPHLAIYEVHSHGICFPTSSVVDRIAPLVLSILLWVLPFIVFLPILFMMLCAYRERNVLGNSQTEERKASDEQMRVVAAIVTSMALFSQFLFVFDYFIPMYKLSYDSPAFVPLHGLSLGVQPVLCFIVLKELREGLRSRCCGQPIPPFSREEEVVQLTGIREGPTSTA